VKEKLFLCIDAGTTRFKAALITPQGEVRNKTDFYYSEQTSPYHEYSPGDFKKALSCTWQKLMKTLRGLSLEAIGITGHGPTLIPVDKKGTPIHPGIGYLDERIKKYIQMLTEKSSNRITSTMYIPIALFFKQELPEIYKNTHCFLQSFDYIAYLLTGVFSASTSSSGIKPWDEQELSSAGLEKSKFPPIRYMGDLIGETTRIAENTLNIPSGIPVYAVGVDFAAAQVGTGALFKGKSCERSGTSGGLNLCWDHKINDPRLLSYTHFVKGCWNVAGITSTSGKALTWIKRIVGTQKLDPELKNRRCDRIIFFPYLRGERTPLWNPFATALFFGLTEKHTAQDMLYAVYLGIALSLRDCLEIIEENGCSFLYPIITTGWGAQDDWFIQLKADVLGKQLARTQLSDAELLGVAAVVASSRSYYNNIIHASQSMIDMVNVFTPNRENFEYYTSLFELYRKIQVNLKEFFKGL